MPYSFIWPHAKQKAASFSIEYSNQLYCLYHLGLKDLFLLHMTVAGNNILSWERVRCFCDISHITWPWQCCGTWSRGVGGGNHSQWCDRSLWEPCIIITRFKFIPTTSTCDDTTHDGTTYNQLQFDHYNVFSWLHIQVWYRSNWKVTSFFWKPNVVSCTNICRMQVTPLSKLIIEF